MEQRRLSNCGLKLTKTSLSLGFRSLSRDTLAGLSSAHVMTHPLDFLDARHLSGPSGLGYAHLVNVRTVPSAEHEISPDLIIRKASREEIDELRQLVSLYGPRNPPRNPFESCITNRLEREGNISYTIQALPEDEFRYNVLEFRNTMIGAYQLVEASCLTETELELGVFVARLGGTYGVGAESGLDRAFNACMDSDDWLLELSEDYFSELRAVLTKLRAHDQKKFDLRVPIGEYLQLRKIPRRYPLRFLGCFAILESLLTHKPKPTDPYESLGRQVKRKLSLLQSRFVHPVSYAEFGTTTHDKIWAAMYEYRSIVAHGAVPEASTPFKVLRDGETALRLLERTTTRVLRQCLEEPQLLIDLREC